MAVRHILSSLIVAASLAGTNAQATSAFTDEATGISFQAQTTEDYSFGIALPSDPTTDFIGQLSANTLTGWAGVSFTGSMLTSLLVLAWANEGEIVSSVREATNYALPKVIEGPTLETISSSVNETGFTYTFLCKNCIDATAEYKTLDITKDKTFFGWAIATTSSPTTPSDAGSSIQQHDTFGVFEVDMVNAKFPDFDKWAASAKAPSSGGNGVEAGPGGNDTLSAVPTAPYNGTITTAEETYDYIVVGGGAAGIVTAQRLVETGKSVLLIERGGPGYHEVGGNLTVPWNNTVSIYEVPGMFLELSGYPGNHGLCSDTAGMAGCILGGGTTVNGMAFIKPPSFDFENWPQGWKWTDGMKEAADRMYERNPGTIQPSSDGIYYDNGLYDVLSKWFSGIGWKEVSTNAEPDEKFQMYGRPAMNIDSGRRAGPVRAYLPLAMKEDNFKLQLNTKVLRAIRTNSTITGVETADNSGARTIYNVNAGGKVILAAGSMSSPRILFNSGIGPQDQIEVAEKQTTPIELPPKEAWINSPVGFVRDHSIIEVIFNVTSGMTILPETSYADPNQTDIDLFAQARGPLVGNPQMRLNTFTTITTSDQSKLVVQTHCWSTANDTIRMMFLLTHGTTSTGRLTMTSEGMTEFSESPYLQTDTDKEAMAMAIDEMLAASRLGNSTLKYSGPANDTGAAIVARTPAQPGTHMTGTTIIGESDGSKNGTAVVDLDCKVYGTDNLFVVDAGMHADLPSGNTHVIVMVAAEHAVQKIIALDNTGYTIPTGISLLNADPDTPPVASMPSNGSYVVPSGVPAASASAPAIPDNGSGYEVPTASSAAEAVATATAPSVPDTGVEVPVSEAAPVGTAPADTDNDENCDAEPIATAAPAAPDNGTGYEVPSASSAVEVPIATAPVVPDTGVEVPPASEAGPVASAPAIPDTGNGYEVPSATSVAAEVATPIVTAAPTGEPASMAMDPVVTYTDSNGEVVVGNLPASLPAGYTASAQAPPPAATTGIIRPFFPTVTEGDEFWKQFAEWLKGNKERIEAAQASVSAKASY